MKSPYDRERELRKKGQIVIDRPLTVAAMLMECGAEPSRLLEPDFDYRGLQVSVPAPIADLLVAGLMCVRKKGRGRAPMDSTLMARILTDWFGISKHKASRLVAEGTGEDPEAIRLRLATRSKNRSRKPQSPKPR